MGNCKKYDSLNACGVWCDCGAFECKRSFPPAHDQHHLKTWPEYFQAAWDGRKPFEVRKMDRDFKVGDMVFLQEWSPETETYLKRQIVARITYALEGGQFGIESGFCVMGLSVVLRLPLEKKETWAEPH